MKTLIMILFFPVFTLAADFDGQTEFTHYELEGRYRVTCFENNQLKSVSHLCRGYQLEPSMWAYFYHTPKSNNVDRVVLATKNDGKTIRKKSKWNRQKNRSKKRINLWVDTVFQNPLLDFGENLVTYKFFEGKTLTERGSFEVFVDDGGLKTCDEESDTFSSIDDCDYGRACSYYFKSVANCQ